jgi:hypothetical protein
MAFPERRIPHLGRAKSGRTMTARLSATGTAARRRAKRRKRDSAGTREVAAALRELGGILREGLQGLASALLNQAPANDVRWSDMDRGFAQNALVNRPTPRPLHEKTKEELEVLARMRTHSRKPKTP